MRWQRFLFAILGFIFTYGIPIALFGCVIPFVRGELERGLTSMGIFALCILILIGINRIKKRVKEWKPSLLRGIINSIFRAVPVAIVAVCLEWLIPFANNLLLYWYRIIPFFIIGCIFYTLEEMFTSEVDK